MFLILYWKDHLASNAQHQQSSMVSHLWSLSWTNSGIWPV